jgi:hypothetical protein
LPAGSEQNEDKGDGAGTQIYSWSDVHLIFKGLEPLTHRVMGTAYGNDEAVCYFSKNQRIFLKRPGNAFF